MSMSQLLLLPSHCKAFSVSGLAATRSKFFAHELMFEWSVAGSSIVIVMRERKRV